MAVGFIAVSTVCFSVGFVAVKQFAFRRYARQRAVCEPFIGPSAMSPRPVEVPIDAAGAKKKFIAALTQAPIGTGWSMTNVDYSSPTLTATLRWSGKAAWAPSGQRANAPLIDSTLNLKADFNGMGSHCMLHWQYQFEGKEWGAPSHTFNDPMAERHCITTNYYVLKALELGVL